MLATRTHLLAAPLGELVSQLKDIAAQIPPVSLHTLLNGVPESTASVSLRCQALRQEKKRKRSTMRSELGVAYKRGQRLWRRWLCVLVWLLRCFFVARRSSVFIRRWRSNMAFSPVIITLFGTSQTLPNSVARRIRVWLGSFHVLFAGISLRHGTHASSWLLPGACCCTSQEQHHQVIGG